MNTEVNNVFDAFLDLQKEEGHKIQNYYMQVAWAEKLFTYGDYKNTEKYLNKIEPDLENFVYDQKLLTRFEFLKFKTLSIKGDPDKKIKSLNNGYLEARLQRRFHPQAALRF